jgi:hypothetical protein
MFKDDKSAGELPVLEKHGQEITGSVEVSYSKFTDFNGVVIIDPKEVAREQQEEMLCSRLAQLEQLVAGVTRQEVAANLRRAAELVKQGWCTERLFEGHGPMNCHFESLSNMSYFRPEVIKQRCAVGGLMEASDFHESFYVASVIAVAETLGCFDKLEANYVVSSYNDEEGRTQENVTDLLERTAWWLERESFVLI